MLVERIGTWLIANVGGIIALVVLFLAGLFPAIFEAVPSLAEAVTGLLTIGLTWLVGNLFGNGAAGATRATFKVLNR